MGTGEKNRNTPKANTLLRPTRTQRHLRYSNYSPLAEGCYTFYEGKKKKCKVIPVSVSNIDPDKRDNRKKELQNSLS